MSLRQPTESELRNAGSLKWTGISSENGPPPLGAWVAEMDYGTAPIVQERLIRAIREGFLGYMPPWLPNAVAKALTQFQKNHFGWAVKPEWIRSTKSVMTALRSTITHMTKPNSPVVVPTPAYMPFLTTPQSLGRNMIPVPSCHTADNEQVWSLNLPGIENALKAGAGLIILCNPWNPTGRVFCVEELEALNQIVTKYGALVFSDEIHAPLILGDTNSHVSYASMGPRFASHTVTAVSASKAWNIPGLQQAQIILPDANMQNEWDTQVPPTDGTPLGALATVTAYTEGQEWLNQVLNQISINLNLLNEALCGTVVDFSFPQGTYLAWLGFQHYKLDVPPAEELLNNYGVAVVAGHELGEPYSKWLRVNTAMSSPLWERTVEKIATFASSAPLRSTQSTK